MADNDKLSQNGREESETEEKIIREMEAQKTENSAEEASVFSDLLHSMGFTKRQSDEKVLQEELENYERQLEQQAEPTEKIDTFFNLVTPVTPKNLMAAFPLIAP